MAVGEVPQPARDLLRPLRHQWGGANHQRLRDLPAGQKERDGREGLYGLSQPHLIREERGPALVEECHALVLELVERLRPADAVEQDSRRRAQAGEEAGEELVRRRRAATSLLGAGAA